MREILTQKNIDDILSIIRHQPAIRLMEFSDKDIGLSQALLTLAKEENYEYKLHILEQKLYETWHKSVETYKLFSMHSTRLEENTFANGGRFYDYLFVNATIEALQKDSFIKNVYKIIKSGGNIIILLPKSLSPLEYWQLLEDNFFVAINSIELTEEYTLLIAKKMHGWGG